MTTPQPPHAHVDETAVVRRQPGMRHGHTEVILRRAGDGMLVAAKAAETDFAAETLAREWAAREWLRTTLGERGPETTGLLRARRALNAAEAEAPLPPAERPYPGMFACEVLPERSVQQAILDGEAFSESEAVQLLDAVLALLVVCREAGIGPPDLRGHTLFRVDQRIFLDGPGTDHWSNVPPVLRDLAVGLGGPEPSERYEALLAAFPQAGDSPFGFEPASLRETLRMQYGASLSDRLPAADVAAAAAAATTAGGTHACPRCRTEYLRSIPICERCHVVIATGQPALPPSEAQPGRRRVRLRKPRAGEWVGWAGILGLVAVLSATFGLGWVAVSVLLGVALTVLALTLLLLQ